jgi:hypothetical protein
MPAYQGPATIKWESTAARSWPRQAALPARPSTRGPTTGARAGLAWQCARTLGGEFLSCRLNFRQAVALASGQKEAACANRSSQVLLQDDVDAI